MVTHNVDASKQQGSKNSKRRGKELSGSAKHNFGQRNKENKPPKGNKAQGTLPKNKSQGSRNGLKTTAVTMQHSQRSSSTIIEAINQEKEPNS